MLTECTRPHLAQVGATFSPTGTGYPGLSRLSAIAGSECPVRLRKALRSGAPALIWRTLIPEKSDAKAAKQPGVGPQPAITV